MPVAAGSLLERLGSRLPRLLASSARIATQPPLRRVFQAAHRAVAAGNPGAALAQLDRAWRTLDQAPALASPLGLCLLLDGSEPAAALRTCEYALNFAPDPDATAARILALLRLGRTAEARSAALEALSSYCAPLDSLLAAAALEVARHPEVGAPGWVGRGQDLALIGQLLPGPRAHALDVTLDGTSVMVPIVPGRAHGDFRLQLPIAPDEDAGSVDVRLHGTPLLGSGAPLALDFAVDGRASQVRSQIAGWARLGWQPDRPVRLRVEDESGRHQEFISARQAAAPWRWSFHCDRRRMRLRGQRWSVSVLCPDERWRPLPDSPLLLSAAVPPFRRGRLRDWPAAASQPVVHSRPVARGAVDVIIPVYGDRDGTLACIESVLATLPPGCSVIVVDDATPDPQLARALDALAAADRISLLRNERNLGFVAAVNRALPVHPGRDVVLLNADTRVCGDWLARLRAAAAAQPKVATVTPLSNHGTLASYPDPHGTSLSPERAGELHALASGTLDATMLRIPVGVGFCLYITRRSLETVGPLDAATFGLGYGEESDFCLRASAHGFSHWLAADVYVYHAGAGSFGARRAALLDRAHRLINLRHPGHDALIESFAAQDPVLPLRRRLDEQALRAFEGRFVLLLTLALPGGVAHHLEERIRQIRDSGRHALILRPAQARDASRCELSAPALEVPNLRYRTAQDLPQLEALLRALRIDAIELHHFLHLDARVIDLARALGHPYDVIAHDYAWFCPRITLIDASHRYCGEPDEAACTRCVRRNGSNLGERISVPALRERSARWLAGARSVSAPSRDAAQRLQRHFEGLEVQVRPHTAPPPAGAAPTPRPPAGPGEPVRVALIGAIGEHKGYGVLLECARDARRRRLPLEFTVIGYTEADDPLLATGQVVITGRYQQPELPALIARHAPHLAWLPSVAPETWCFALDHALEAGLPVLAFDLGAPAERLRALDLGTLVPMDLSPRQLNDRLLAAGRGHRAAPRIETKLPPAADIPDKMTPAPQRNFMAKAAPAHKPDARKTADPVIDGLAASVQVLPLPAGLYLFSVKSAHPKAGASNGSIALPAVHVGLGPGVRSEQVEFIAGPRTHGAWLFSTEDLLVTRVNGNGATLILASIRGPGGDTLSIRVERLDTRTDALGSPAASAAAVGSEGAAARPAPRPAAPPAPPARDALAALPMSILAHIRGRGDLRFDDAPWAGRIAPGLWLESFAVLPGGEFGAADVEYKGLTGSGFETPWLSEGKMCGTRQMATPLVGFAVRLKPGERAAQFNCEYSGYFASGVVVGPLRNGAPCRSTVANDPLEGIQVRILPRTPLAPPAPAPAPARAARPASKSNGGAARHATHRAGHGAHPHPHSHPRGRKTTRKSRSRA